MVISICICYFLKNSYLNHVKTQLVTEANRIENTLADTFSETYHVMLYIGKQISLYGKNEPRFIEKMLFNSSEIALKIKTVSPWSLFDWVDLNNRVVVNSQIGIIPNPSEKVHDSYTLKCPEAPWTLQLSRPTIGNTSGMWAIPAGMGITDKQNKYLGTLNVGFVIAELNNKIQQALIAEESSFVVLDEDLRIVFQSADNSIDPKSSYYRDLLKNKKYFKEDKAYLENPITYKEIEYVYYKKMEDFPYIILTGFDKQMVQDALWNLILPRLFELYGVGAFCLALLYFLRKKLFNLTTASETNKEIFFQSAARRMRDSISSVLTYCDVLIKSLKGETNIIVTKDRQIEFIEKIYTEALNLYTMTTDTLNITCIYIDKLIENSVSILIKATLKKNITIKTSFASHLLPFNGDEFCLKQIVTSFIALAINYCPKGATIKISALNELKNKQMFLVIKVKDNGFKLDAKDIMRISERFSHTQEQESIMTTQLDFASIEKLVQLHDGKCYIYNKEPKGKIIEVVLPYRADASVEEREIDMSKTSNVHWLPRPSKSDS